MYQNQFKHCDLTENLILYFRYKSSYFIGLNVCGNVNRNICILFSFLRNARKTFSGFLAAAIFLDNGINRQKTIQIHTS